MRTRYCIAGTGVVCSLGNDTKHVWQQIIDGRSGLSRHQFPALQTPATMTEWAAPVCLNSAPDINDKLTRISLEVCTRAIAQTDGLWNSIPPRRRGLCFGLSKPDFHHLEAHAPEDVPLDKLYPQSTVSSLINQFNIQGPNTVPVAACATGAMALLQAMLMIEARQCDIVLVGSADCSCHPMVFGSYHRLGVLQSAMQSEAQLSGPFCVNRNGFHLGEGAGALVLCREGLNRTASSECAEICLRSVAVGSDPTGLTVVDATGEALAQVITSALRCADCTPDQISAINVHGTGTILNDLAEANAIARVFGSTDHQPRCFSLKPALGHLLGATSSVELALVCELIEQQRLPPKLTQDILDPECPIHYVSTQAEDLPAGPILKLALGFGGHLCAIVLDR